MAVANECIPYYEDGHRVTAYAGAAVTGKRFVAVSAGLSTAGNVTCAPASAAGKVFGVASHDAAEKGLFTVLKRLIVPVTASGTIEPGEEVGVATGGKAVKAEASSEAEIKEGKGPYKVPPVGMAVAKATDGKDCHVALYH